LRIKDTEWIDPARLAEQLEEMGANALCFNVGGIYAWYDTKVEYHTKNPYLPKGWDLLEEVIENCHKRNIKFIARFDFSKAEDSIYQKRPWWFVRDPAGEPQIIGATRPGEWSLLMATCINSGYRKEEVAMPVLDEVLSRYDIDAIFYNNPGFIPCHCSICRRKYEKTYDRPLPEDKRDFDPGWRRVCEKDTLGGLYAFVKSKKPDIPVVMYYDIYGEDMLVRERFGDAICVESQNVLSAGHKNIPPIWHPALSMNLGRSLEGKPNPFGIIHSCPGMDWRHTGLPPAEYLYWMSNVPANGGNIWHSLTGIPDTITDKRILKSVARVNRWAAKVEEAMEDAKSVAQVALVWEGSSHARGWAEGLTSVQVPFDILKPAQLNLERIKKYKVLILPSETRLTSTMVDMLSRFLTEGGSLILEGGVVEGLYNLQEMAGINGEPTVSEYLTACYIRFEGTDNPVQRGMEETELIPLRGKVTYVRPRTTAKVLSTLVPPFSPLEAVGAPPERASFSVSHTDIPLCLFNEWGKGKVLTLLFPLGSLIGEYRLSEHFRYARNAVDLLIGRDTRVRFKPQPGLQVSVFQKEEKLVIHLVNGAGKRPLMENIPLYNVQMEVMLDWSGGRREKLGSVRQLLGDESPIYEQTLNIIKITVPVVKVWECIIVEIQKEQ